MSVIKDDAAAEKRESSGGSWLDHLKNKLDDTKLHDVKVGLIHQKCVFHHSQPLSP